MINVLDHTVKAVIDDRFMGGITTINLQSMRSTAVWAKSHMVNNGCCTATRSCAGTGKKIITTARDADINIEMRMDIHAARENVTASGINFFIRELRRNIVAQLANNPAFNQQILFGLSIGVNDTAALINTRIATSKTLRRTGGE